MKRFYIFVVLTLCLFVNAFSQDDFFKKFADREDITSVYISKSMLRLMPNVQADGIDVGSVASKLDNIQILSCEKQEVVPLIRQELKYISPKNGYEELMKVNDEGEHTVIYLKETPGHSKEYILLCDEKKELTVVILKGSLSLSDIQGIIKQ